MIAFLVQLSIPVLWMGSYQLNKNSWTISFCENIDKPELDCKAKCFLNKKIKETQSEQAPNDAMVNIRVDFLYLSDLLNQKKIDLNHYDRQFIYKTSYYDFSPIRSVFRPPVV